jgi:RNA polymerase sigma-32 factor
VSRTLPIPSELHATSLAAYIQAVNAQPVLSAEDERVLGTRYHEEEDLEAARTLILANLRHVVRIARGFMGYGLPLADLVQEGNIGLMKAVRHYDPDRGVRLLSFAVHWIRAEIYDYVLRNWRIVKVATTKAQRKLFFNLRKSRARIGWMSQQETDALAESLDVPTATVKEMESRLSAPDVSFDGDTDEDDGFALAPAAYLGDLRYNPERVLSERDELESGREGLAGALEALDSRSRDIVQRRWLSEDKPTLHELADEYGVSAERIRQIEKRALERMRDSLAA